MKIIGAIKIQELFKSVKKAKLKITPAATTAPAVLRPQPSTDVAELKETLAELQAKAFERLVQKLDLQVVKKADIKRLMESFPEEDRKYVKQVLFQSADKLRVDSFITKTTELKRAGDKVFPLSTEGRALKYLERKFQWGDHDIRRLDEIGSIDGPGTILLADKIASKILSTKEVEAISKAEKVMVFDGLSENGLTFFDFAKDTSGEAARKKTARIVKKAKKIKAQKPQLTEKQAVRRALRQIEMENISDINKERAKKGLPPVMILTPEHKISLSDTAALLKTRGNRYHPPQIRSMSDFLKYLALNPLSIENFKEELRSDLLQKPDFLRLLASDKGVRVYTPQKTFDALRDISAQLSERLKKDGIKPSQVYFVNQSGAKSDNLMAHMFRKISHFPSRQFLDVHKVRGLAEKEFFEGKAIVFLDDVNGSGSTTQDVIDDINWAARQAKAIYLGHLVSFDAGKNIFKDSSYSDKIHHLVHQDGISIQSERHPIYTEIPSPSEFKKMVKNWDSYNHTGGAEGFFFSVPDNTVSVIGYPLRKGLNIPG